MKARFSTLRNSTRTVFLCLPALMLIITAGCGRNGNSFRISDGEFFETRGVDVLVFSNWYNGYFSDSKMSGIEIIHHGVRTVTNGDVRLTPTPEQWDAIPRFVERRVDSANNAIRAWLRYDAYDFDYCVVARAGESGIDIGVELDKPLPEELEGKAGFNLEFLPSAYFGKTWIMDGKTGLFPLYPGGPMETDRADRTLPLPLAGGNRLVVAPGAPGNRIAIESDSVVMHLYDGRNKAQNGWYVLRSLIPGAKTGWVIQWHLEPAIGKDWVRSPVIAHSQLGYHPAQQKVARIELDPNDKVRSSCKLIRVGRDGSGHIAFKSKLNDLGHFLRYNYYGFDFTPVTAPGIYVIEYGNVRTDPFRISADIYRDAWHPSLDVYLPVQMDHMLVNEAYRVWHGAAHLDDALQAPVNHDHFDLYAQGPATDSPYRPGQHIPGLNIGGWFDAGDYDIRTQTQYAVVLRLVQCWEDFRPERDETLIDESTRYVDIHHPDGVPDLIQQIEHGTLQLLAQYRAIGHAIPGIIVPHLSQYTHLGDALTMTDNLVYDPALDSLESNGFRSGTFDDRWAFTTRTTALNYGSAAALAAAGRVLQGYNEKLAAECIETATGVWNEEQSHEPVIFRHGNTTGGALGQEELKAAVELLVSTGDDRYAARIREMMPAIREGFVRTAALAVRAVPHMDEEYKEQIDSLVRDYADNLAMMADGNPFGVPVGRGGWAGNGLVMNMAITNYIVSKAFPGVIDPEFVYRGLNYLYGCHPGSDISFVSGVGARSKKVAYGMNRADFSFIAGGVVPGVLILNPDFPENKEDWPFLWGENEYVVTPAAAHIYLVNAVSDLLGNRQ